MPTNTSVTRARHAAAVRWDKPNIKETARDHAAAKLEDYVAKVIAAAPPLTNEQRERIAALLAPGVMANA